MSRAATSSDFLGNHGVDGALYREVDVDGCHIQHVPVGDNGKAGQASHYALVHRLPRSSDNSDG